MFATAGAANGVLILIDGCCLRRLLNKTELVEELTKTDDLVLGY